MKKAHAGLSPTDRERKITLAGRGATVDGIYLRIIIHTHEHMGQLIAYARFNDISQPWSESGSK
ncbi:MAG: hypothetical protein ACJ746_07295 [Bryobacteraceae bacterium]